MKLLNAQQIKALDAFTIQHEPISSLDLMERASRACVKRLVKLIPTDAPVLVFCGTGNNGGDGLAISRLLLDIGYSVKTFFVRYSEKISPDASENYQALQNKYPLCVHEINNGAQLPSFAPGATVIDALLGTGIHTAPAGLLEETIAFINQFNDVISVDLPSGLFPDRSSSENKSIVHSRLTLTFHAPKLAFLLPENFLFVPVFEVLDIGLSAEGISLMPAKNHFTTSSEISSLLQPRQKFSHKGSFGHALLLAGSPGKSGAAIIASKACLRSGAGYLTLHSTKETLQALLLALPEAMSNTDPHPDFITEVNDLEKYDAVGFGPGVGDRQETQTVLKKILQFYSGNLVIDADGLNILSENRTWLDFLPADTVLTPHPKEFERLSEKAEDDFDRLEILRRFSVRYSCIVILKGAHTAVAMPDGNVFFNSSGNAGLAKAGSGDGLTGIILGMMARGYTPPQAALIGVYVHGLAADLCARKKSMESILISDVIEKLPNAFRKLEK